MNGLRDIRQGLGQDGETWGLAAAVLVIAAAFIFAISTYRAPALPPKNPIHPHVAAVAQKHAAMASVPLKIVAAAKPTPKPAMPSDFDREQALDFRQRMNRWQPFIVEASQKYGVPQSWIRAVMQAESGGRTMLAQDQPITSSAGAMGLMQVMPQTYRDMRLQYGLGADPYDPHDNIMAGAAYLRFLRAKYPYPTMFAAYNDGPGNLEARLLTGGLLPAETELYVARVTNTLNGGGAFFGGRGNARFTKPNGDAVMLNTAAIVSVRAAFLDEYAPGVQSVITIGRVHQGVRESLAQTKAIIRAHGGGI
jgi:soluble lytic murein transglycosylase-like protein